MTHRLLIIGGDGVGPEVTAQARRVAEWFMQYRAMPLELHEAEFGVASLRRCGRIMDEDTISALHRVDAVLFGAIGGPEYDALPLHQVRTEGLLRIRKELGLYANLRPVRAWAPLADVVAYKPDHIAGVNMLIVRELAGGIYYGEPRGIVEEAGKRVGINTQRYASSEIVRIARFAFELAARNGMRLHSVDKSNVLESGVLWREEVTALHRAEFDGVELHHILVDNCALQLAVDPGRFQVLLADNLFGDILSDAAGAVSGSLGMLPSASFGAAPAGRATAFYEPVHGSAPDIAGKGVANPIGTILSLAMAFEWSFGRAQDARLLEDCIGRVLQRGIRTADVAGGRPAATTEEMGSAIIAELSAQAGRPH